MAATTTPTPTTATADADAGNARIEQWDFLQLALPGPESGNPFLDVELSARFTHGDATVVDVTGFYDGGGTYRVRFMPTRLGPWRYETRSNAKALHGKTGTFTCVPATGNNHGPVGVHNTFHFRHADGTPYRQIGTTCYAWTHQDDELEERTLATLSGAPFNKIRMCVFPKRYAFNQNEPPRYPFAGTPPNRWDFTRFNPAFWQHLERRVGQLRDLGIEADLILFHPYDVGHWGFDRMDPASDDRYLRYCVARLAAFRNVWWSMANEFDFMKEKTDADWDRYFHVVKEADPYGHLRSVHNGKRIYDHNKPWVTHASIQNGMAVEDFGRAVLYRDVYYKPVVLDEVRYEGDIDQRWGNISPEEMVHDFWQGTVAGTYVGHGETYKRPDEVLWWSKGGTLRGQSPARIAFLRRVLESAPTDGLEPIDKWWDARTAGKPGEYYLVYFGRERPTEWVFELARYELVDGMTFEVDVLDTWDMTITPVGRTFKVKQLNRYVFRAEDGATVKLPGKPWQALRIRRVNGAIAPAAAGPSDASGAV
jgi:hypothetical protein